MCALTPVTKFLNELPADWEFFPISDLHPFHSRWIIKAQVKLKTTTIYKSKDKRKFFSVILADDSGEIQALIFDEECDKYCDILEVNQVYVIHRGLIKEARNNTEHSRHPYELSFNSLTRVVPWKKKCRILRPPLFLDSICHTTNTAAVKKETCTTSEIGPIVCAPKVEEKSIQCEESAFMNASGTPPHHLQIEKFNSIIDKRGAIVCTPVGEEKSTQCEESVVKNASHTPPHHLQIEKFNCTIAKRGSQVPVEEEEECDKKEERQETLPLRRRKKKKNFMYVVPRKKRKVVKRQAQASPPLSDSVLLDSTHEESFTSGFQVHPVEEEEEEGQETPPLRRRKKKKNFMYVVPRKKRKVVKRRARASPSLSDSVLVDSTHEESFTSGTHLTSKKKSRRRKIKKRAQELRENNDVIIEGEAFRIFESPLQFAPLLQVAMLKENDMIDVIGVVKCWGDTNTEVIENDLETYQKREIFLVDQSNLGVVVELWNRHVREVPADGSPVLAVIGAVVCCNGRAKRLLVTEESTVSIDPDIPEASRLSHWSKDSERLRQQKRDISNPSVGGFLALSWMTIKEIKDICTKERMSEPLYFTCKVIVQGVDSPEMFYKACPESFCNKIVHETNIDTVRCSNCCKEYTSFNYCLPLLVNFVDATGSFNASVPPWELQRLLLSFSMYDPQNIEALGNARVLTEALRSLIYREFIIRIRATKEITTMGNLVRFAVECACPLRHQKFSRYLLEKICLQNIS